MIKLSNLRNQLRHHLINIPGWRTNRKIIVFESDDWGSIRMTSKKVYNWFYNKGYEVDKCPYNKNDSIECNEDLELLFEVLNSVEDRKGNPAIFTVNNIVANPDFFRIKESGFCKYYFEPFTQTLERYSGRDRVYELYLEGISHGIFRPQFHGREHLNLNRWMEGLNSGNKILHEAFGQKMFTVRQSDDTGSGRKGWLDAFGLGYQEEWEGLNNIIESGLDIFENLWGYRSLSCIAPCYVWSQGAESILAKNGVKYIQGTHVQRVPVNSSELSIKRKYHYLGQRNKLGQRYLVRNVHFEPTEDGRRNAVDKALRDIELAFRYNKPAIVSSHRVNYIGSIRRENRNKNLLLLKNLLNQIVTKYPEVEFMTSDQLGNLISRGN